MVGPSQRASGTQRPHMRSGGAGAVVGCAKTGTDQQLGEGARKRVHAPSSRFLEDVPPNMGSIKSECLNSTESHWINPFRTRTQNESCAGCEQVVHSIVPTAYLVIWPAHGIANMSY